MEKIRLGFEMATRWTDPTFMIIVSCVGFIILNTVVVGAIAYVYEPLVAAKFLLASIVIQYVWYNYIYMRPRKANTTNYITFTAKGKHLEKLYKRQTIPIQVLYDGYINGEIDFNGDVYEVLAEHRYKFVSWRLTFTQVKWLISQLIPSHHDNSSDKDERATKKEIAEHYDRGNDFFSGFMGPLMVYTSGVYYGLKQTLEEAQINKMNMICDKLQMKPGQRFLDIGCGWGTLVRHAAREYKCKAVGVTLSQEGANWCNDRNEEEGLEDDVDILYMDYRNIPKDEKFDGIASIEMAEHVGLKNFQLYLHGVKSLLKDDSSFLMQVAGLRQGSNWEDVAWGLFMSRYIFPGADASTPLNWYIRQLELAGFEVQSVETIGRHYGHTLYQWYLNWESNKDELRGKYGDRLCRMWSIFLAWSTIAAGQGSATCYQILSHKNINNFPRDIYCEGEPGTIGVGVRTQDE